MRVRQLCRAMFDAAVARAQPAICLPPHLPAPPAGRLIVLACGKAGAAMAETVERHYLGGALIPPHRLEGICVTRHGYGRPLARIRCVEAGHPVPDAAGLAATADVLALAATAHEGDLVLVLVSGGGSANWTAPAEGIGLEDKQALTRALLASGAPIDDINTVRKHLSRIKGGRLAAAIHPAPSLTLAMSDVPGDDPAVIASGPTVPDPTSAGDAVDVLRKWKVEIPAAISAALSKPEAATPGPGDPVFARAEFRLVARPADSLAAAASVAREHGYDVEILGDALEGEAREVAAGHARLALAAAQTGRPTILLSGGELTVTIRGSGRGGPNQEYALALVAELDSPCVSGLAADTDGTDGGGGAATDPAGAFFDPTSRRRAVENGLNPAVFLANNDATGFFERLGDLLVTGATGTNVNDFRCLVVDKPDAATQNPVGDQDDVLESAGEAMRLLLGLVLAAALYAVSSATLPTSARADLRVCNKTPSRVGIAIGYKAEKDWMTEGWWTVDADRCETLLAGPLASRYYYMYAVDYERGGEWGGTTAYLCTQDKEFTIEGVNDCVARGYQRTGFYEIDTGSQSSWTVQLTEPTSGGVGGQ